VRVLYAQPEAAVASPLARPVRVHLTTQQKRTATSEHSASDSAPCVALPTDPCTNVRPHLVTQSGAWRHTTDAVTTSQTPHRASCSALSLDVVRKACRRHRRRYAMALCFRLQCGAPRFFLLCRMRVLSIGQKRSFAIDSAFENDLKRKCLPRAAPAPAIQARSIGAGRPAFPLAAHATAYAPRGAEAIHAASRQSPFAAYIRFLGFVRTPDLPDLYPAADVFVYPSLYEGFGMPPIEAGCIGCPVICSARGSLGSRSATPRRLSSLKTSTRWAKELAEWHR